VFGVEIFDTRGSSKCTDLGSSFTKRSWLCSCYL